MIELILDIVKIITDALLITLLIINIKRTNYISEDTKKKDPYEKYRNQDGLLVRNRGNKNE